jgi:hypothetical protein
VVGSAHARPRLPPAFRRRPGLAQPEPHRARGDASRALDEFRAALAEYAAALRLASNDAALLAAQRGEAPPPDAAAMQALRHAFGPWIE